MADLENFAVFKIRFSICLLLLATVLLHKSVFMCIVINLFLILDHFTKVHIAIDKSGIQKQKCKFYLSNI